MFNGSIEEEGCGALLSFGTSYGLRWFLSVVQEIYEVVLCITLYQARLYELRLFPFVSRENYFEKDFGCWSPKFLV